MRTLILAVAMMLWAQGAHAQDVRKVAEIYETEVFANSLINGEQVQTLLPARLTAYPAELHGGTTSITLEMDPLTTASYIRIPRTSLPVEYEHVFGNDSERWLYARSSGHFNSRYLEFDLTSPAGNDLESNSYNLTVYDGTGKPAAGVHIEISPYSNTDDPQVTLVSTTIDANGKLRVSLPVRPKDPNAHRNPPGFYPGPGYQLIATDVSGQKQVMFFPPPQPDFSIADDGSEVHLALIPRQADAVAYRGTVADETGAPVAGARILYRKIELPEKGMEHFRDDIGTIHTAPDGTFSITVPRYFLKARLSTEVLPPATTLHVNVEEVKSARLEPGRDNRIVIPHTEALTFQLLASDGQPLKGVDNNRSLSTELTRIAITDGATPSSDGCCTETEIFRIDAEIISQEQGIIRLPRVPLPGRYGLRYKDYDFEPRPLAKGAGSSTIVWQLSGHRATLSGRVLEAETAAPIAGAYVLGAVDQDSLRDFAALSDDQRELLFSTWLNGDKKSLFENDITIKLGDKTYLIGIRTLAKTNANGEFLLNYEPDIKPGSVVVYAPGRVGAICTPYTLDKNNILQLYTMLPDVALPLKAEVSFTANAPEIVADPFLSNKEVLTPVNNKADLLAGVSFERTGSPWKADLPLEYIKRDAPWELGVRSGWFESGSSVTSPVPAGIKLSVTASGVPGDTLGSVTWPDIGPLQPGQKIDLPAKTIPAKRPFLVTVRKADGTPAVGVAVQIDGALPLTTDKDGAVIGWSSGHVRRVEALTGNSEKVAAQKTDIEVPQSGEMINVDLVIP